MVAFITLTVAYTYTAITLLGVLSFVFAVLVVVLSIKKGGRIIVLRSLGTGLIQVGVLTLVLELVHIRVMYIDLTTAYWITLVGILLNVG
ncbi:MAG: hypothetical protein QW453_03920, partial [Thermoprotei archaeon]